MKTCFLHVGPHKTGSSSIQKFLRVNQSALLEFNFLYVSLFGGKKIHSNLFLPKQREKLATGKGRGIARREMTRFLESGRNLIISDERLSRQVSEPDFLADFANLLSKFGSRLVLLSVHREQVAHLNSSYVQGVKRFIVKSDIDDFIDAHIADLRYSHRQMKALADTAGVEHRAMSFDYAVGHSTLGAEFVRLLDIDPAGFSEIDNTPSNPNPGALTVLAAERIRSRCPDIAAARSDNESYKNLLRYLRKMNWEKNPYFGITEARQREIYDQFFDENDSFARSSLGKGWDEIVPFRAKPVNAPSYDDLSESEQQNVDVIVDKIVRDFTTARHRIGRVAPNDSIQLN